LAGEPNHESYKVFLNNIQLNRLGKIVICENVVVSDKNGSMYLKEHSTFDSDAYVGSTLFVPETLSGMNSDFR